MRRDTFPLMEKIIALCAHETVGDDNPIVTSILALQGATVAFAAWDKMPHARLEAIRQCLVPSECQELIVAMQAAKHMYMNEGAV